LFISTLEETVRDAEFVFEVVPEDLKIKQELFKSMIFAVFSQCLIVTSSNDVTNDQTFHLLYYWWPTGEKV